MRTIEVGSREDRIAVGGWLVAFAIMIFVIILVGGATRLTESGLSITEWKPVSGVAPPLTPAQWDVEFAKYRRIPQYERLNAGMTLASFKRIYLWEYGHRLAARLVGLAFVLPMGWFLLRRRMPPLARRRVFLLLALLVAQGAMGWWMVKSGLTLRTEVSQYRLAAHLTTAFVLLALVVWTAADLLGAQRPAADTGSPRESRTESRLLGAFLCLVFITSASGALVAGLRAGEMYNTFPLMAGSVIPPAYGQLAPAWHNLFENHAAVQFNHRLLAVTTFLGAVVLWLATRRSPDRRVASRMNLVLAVAVLQLGLGIATLLMSVPFSLAVAHQGGAALLVVAAVLAWHASRPDRQRAGFDSGPAFFRRR